MNEVATTAGNGQKDRDFRRIEFLRTTGRSRVQIRGVILPYSVTPYLVAFGAILMPRQRVAAP
jgi:hypothetical protein